MKYLIFNRIPHDYGAEHDTLMIGSKERGFGAYQDGDAKILKDLHGPLITEIDLDSYNSLKKS